jgi:hypothetical protein
VKDKKQQSQRLPSAPGSAQGQLVAPNTAPLPEDEPETGETEAIHRPGTPGSAEELRRRKALAEQPQAPPEQAACETDKPAAPNADEDEPEA